MSVIKQPFQMLLFFTSIESQWRLRSDCFNDICDIPIIPKGKFIPFAIIANSDNVGTITLHCWDEPFSYTRTENFTKNNCEAGEGTEVSYSKIYYSSTSVNDVQNAAMNDPDYIIEGQQYANENGTCIITYYNVEKSQNFTRNNCGDDYIGSEVTYTVSAATYESNISQEDADAQADADITANGQNYANTNGTCTPKAIYYSEDFESWSGGLPVGWIHYNPALTVISEVSGACKIDCASNPGPTPLVTGIRKNNPLDFSLYDSLKLTVVLTDITHDKDFIFIIGDPTGEYRARLLDAGENEFTLTKNVDYLPDATCIIISDANTPYGGEYPHSVTIDSITFSQV